MDDIKLNNEKLNNDKLQILTKIKKTYEYIDKSLDNYPHRYIELKQRIIAYLLDMMELCYIANNGYDKTKNKYVSLAKLSMIDYSLKISYKKDIISKKKYESISKHLEEIRAMLYGWIKIDEES